MLTVREATPADVDTLYQLIIAIAKHHSQEQYVLTNPEEILKSGFGGNPLFGALLAELDGEVAGYCSYTWQYSIWLGGNYMNIDDVFVWEQFRGMAIGEQLMQKAKAVCLANGAGNIRWEVEEDNHGAIKFYKRLGARYDAKGLFRWAVAA